MVYTQELNPFQAVCLEIEAAAHDHLYLAIGAVLASHQALSVVDQAAALLAFEESQQSAAFLRVAVSLVS